MKDSREEEERQKAVTGTLTLHVRLNRDPDVLRDAAEKGISAAAALWHSITGCRAWVEYRPQGLSVTYSMGAHGPTRDLELGMVGDFSRSRELEAPGERAFFDAVARGFDGEPVGEDKDLRLVATLWKAATGETLVPELPGEVLDARTLIFAMERLNREGMREEHSRSDEQGWSYER